ncbi:MAG: ABC transporter ATP-binding protein [Alphaproteobacteria bacterium]
MSAPAPLLAMRGICKSFGAVRANRNVDLALSPGEVLGLLGENGAGKTTLMNVLFGIYAADAGTISIDGHRIDIRGPADALAAGIGMVHQHFHLVPGHSVLENLIVGRKGRRGRLDFTAARARLAEIAREYGLRLDPDRLVSTLGVGEQQRLEIVKALFRGARVLILDEPTSVLTPQESEGLFAAIRAMARSGVGVIFISHKLNEVREITDRIAVMRQGEMVATIDNAGDLTNRGLAELMCGRELTPPVKEKVDAARVLLRLDGVSVGRASGRPAVLREISLELRGGEILGIAGVSGSGQRELAEVIAGLIAPTTGRIEIDGRPVTRHDPKAMQALGAADIPEDRIGAGLLGSLPLADSMVLPRIAHAPFSRRGFLRHGAIRGFVAEQIERFDIKAEGPEVRTGTLSGGNLQKALLARELAWDPLVLVAAQPTRGLDVGAQEFVHRQFLDLRARGRAVLLISEDLEELFALSDRLAVMFEGRILDVLPAAEATVGRVGLLMTGVREAA